MPRRRTPKRAPLFGLARLPSGERLFVFTDRNVSNASFANCEGDPHGPTGDPREAPTGRRWMYGSTAPRPGERPISDWTPFRT